jgi:hypothetical protein
MKARNFFSRKCGLSNTTNIILQRQTRLRRKIARRSQSNVFNPLSNQILRARPRCLQRQTGEHQDFIQNSRRFGVVVGDGEYDRVLNNIEETSRSKFRFVRSQASGSWQLFLVPPQLFCGRDRLFLYRSNPMCRNSSRRAWPM